MSPDIIINLKVLAHVFQLMVSNDGASHSHSTLASQLDMFMVAASQTYFPIKTSRKLLFTRAITLHLRLTFKKLF